MAFGEMCTQKTNTHRANREECKSAAWISCESKVGRFGSVGLLLLDGLKFVVGVRCYYTASERGSHFEIRVLFQHLYDVIFMR